jgi:multiple sugar transport system substrate-binding protein
MKKFFVMIILIVVLVSSIGFAKTKLTFATHWIDYQLEGRKDKDGNIVTKGLRQYVEEYMKINPDIEIEIQSVQFNEYLTRILVGSLAGSASDIYVLYSLWGAQLVDSGILDKAPNDIANIVQKDFVEAAVAGATFNNEIWGIPTEIANYALVYNKEILKKGGYDGPPQTWDELIDMSSNLTIRSKDGAVEQYGYVYDTFSNSGVVHPYLARLYSLGGKLFTDDYKSCLLDSKEAIQALEAELEIFRRGGTDTEASEDDFYNKKAAMAILAAWKEPEVKIALGEEYEKIIGVVPIPPLKEPKTVSYTWFAGVDSRSSHKKEAWEFLKWFCLEPLPNGSTRMGEMLAKNIGAIPSRYDDIDAFPEELNDIYTSVYVKELENAVPEPNVAQGEEIKNILWREIMEARNGRKSAEVALHDAKIQIDEILKEFY